MNNMSTMPAVLFLHLTGGGGSPTIVEAHPGWWRLTHGGGGSWRLTQGGGGSPLVVEAHGGGGGSPTVVDW